MAYTSASTYHFIFEEKYLRTPLKHICSPYQLTAISSTFLWRFFFLFFYVFCAVFHYCFPLTFIARSHFYHCLLVCISLFSLFTSFLLCFASLLSSCFFIVCFAFAFLFCFALLFLFLFSPSLRTQLCAF